MLAEPDFVADMLGLTASAAQPPFRLMSSIEAGLPVDAVDRLARTVAPLDAEFRHRLVPRATLARRKNDPKARLTTGQSDRVARIAGLWAHALRVWKDEGATRAFLFRPHAMLEGRCPIDAALGTELGADLVDDILGGLEFGSAV